MNGKPFISAFEDQRPEEKIFVFLRRHPVAFLPQILVIAGVAVVAFILVIIFSVAGSEFIARESLVDEWLVVGLSAFFLFAGTFFMVSWIDFYLDIYIVTDTRLVDIDQERMFHRAISELTFEQVEDVRCVIKGVLGTFFDFGMIEIQTAGSQRNFFFEQIAHPRTVAQIIIDLVNQDREGVHPKDRIPHRVLGVVNNQLIYPQSSPKPAIMNLEREEIEPKLKEEPEKKEIPKTREIEEGEIIEIPKEE